MCRNSGMDAEWLRTLRASTREQALFSSIDFPADLGWKKEVRDSNSRIVYGKNSVVKNRASFLLQCVCDIPCVVVTGNWERDTRESQKQLEYFNLTAQKVLRERSLFSCVVCGLSSLIPIVFLSLSCFLSSLDVLVTSFSFLSLPMPHVNPVSFQMIHVLLRAFFFIFTRILEPLIVIPSQQKHWTSKLVILQVT